MQGGVAARVGGGKAFGGPGWAHRPRRDGDEMGSSGPENGEQERGAETKMSRWLT